MGVPAKLSILRWIAAILTTPLLFQSTAFAQETIFGSTPFTVREAEFGLYNTYTIQPAKPEAVAQAFEALRRAVEQVPGATFVEQSRER